ncbi:MAG: CpsB/CapC family capsule biosynthesis tyrosine phosphatase [Thermodesulfobacteriota bacterium]
MIDIHSHILPGLDDGAADLDTALAMARMAVADGIIGMIATPHISHDSALAREEIARQVAALNAALAEQGISLAIYAGAEVPLGHELAGSSYLLHNGPYILVEFPHSHIPGNAAEQLFALRCAGLIPIIAHPERNGEVLREPERLVELVAAGALSQLTAESLTGELGSQVQQCSHYLLRKKLGHFLATDCHSLRFRRPKIKKALKIARRLLGKDPAQRLVGANPEAVINGTPL